MNFYKPREITPSHTSILQVGKELAFAIWINNSQERNFSIVICDKFAPWENFPKKVQFFSVCFLFLDNIVWNIYRCATRFKPPIFHFL